MFEETEFAIIKEKGKTVSKKRVDKVPSAPAPEPTLQTPLKPKTLGQAKYLRTVIENDVTFVTGDAGTGKSYLAIGLACQYLLERRYDYIVVARPTIEASQRGLGFVPGDITEKMSPYVYPALENMKKFLGNKLFTEAIRSGIIKIEALEYMRGRTYDRTFMILEEAQNATTEQLKMFVTRIGLDSKIVINGDTDQADLRYRDGQLDLSYVISKIEKANLDKFGVAHLTESDIVRSPLIAGFLRAMR